MVVYKAEKEIIPVIRAFGVPQDPAERKAISNNYLNRKIEVLQKTSKISEKDIEIVAKQTIINDLDQFLGQIAGRSQTLLAVIAIFIGMFIAISENGSFIRMICLLWAITSATLFYNIWIFFGNSEYYRSYEAEFEKTTELVFKRSSVFNANIIYSIGYFAICSVAFVFKM